MKEALKTNPQFFDGAIYTKMGAWQDYLILAMSEAQALAWLQSEAKSYSCEMPQQVYPRENPETLAKFAPGVVRPVHMVNVCTFGYEQAQNNALAFYDALVKGTETFGDIAETHSVDTLSHLIYILGSLMENDKNGNDEAYIELCGDAPEETEVRSLLNEMIAECPDLAPALNKGLSLCRVLED